MSGHVDYNYAFFVSEVIAAALLACRGRQLLLFAAPLFAQELLHHLLWLEVEADEASQASYCEDSGANACLSLLSLATILGTPCWWALCALRALDAWSHAVGAAAREEGEHAALRHGAGAGSDAGSDAGEHEDAWLRLYLRRVEAERRALRTLASAGAFFAGAAFSTSSLAVRLGWWFPFCTTRGTRTGQQLWPWLTPSLAALPGGSLPLAAASVAAWLGRIASFGWSDALGARAGVTAAAAAELLLHLCLAAAFLALLGKALELWRGVVPRLDAPHSSGLLPQVTTSPYLPIPPHLLGAAPAGHHAPYLFMHLPISHRVYPHLPISRHISRSSRSSCSRRPRCPPCCSASAWRASPPGGAWPPLSSSRARCSSPSSSACSSLGRCLPRGRARSSVFCAPRRCPHARARSSSCGRPSRRAVAG